MTCLFNGQIQMNTDNIRRREIRLEDSFHEAKISEPAPNVCVGRKCNAKMGKNDDQTTSEDDLARERTATQYREG